MIHRNTRRGFTLIELLVVVLIIGILAAVAVPQYQKAVLKSRFAGAISNTVTIAKALEIYYLANGTYPASLEDIDVSIGGCTTAALSIACADAVYYYYHWEENGKTENFISVILKNKLGLAYIHYMQEGNSFLPNRAMRRYCWADSTNEAANQICLSMQGIADGTDNWNASLINSGRWNKYKLPK